MFKIAIASLKGGTGKTTTSILLAEAAELAGLSSMVVDLDPQSGGSSRNWADYAAEEQGLRSLVMSISAKELTRRLPEIADKRDIVIIDTPPGSENTAAAAIRAADLLVIPINARLADMERVAGVAHLADEVDVPVKVVLCRTRPKVKAAQEIRDALEGIGIPVAQTQIDEQEKIGASYGMRPTPHALRAYSALWDELKG